VGDLIVNVLLLVGGIAVYLLPALVADRRGHKNLRAIFVLNLAAGWTFVGWVAALVWALMR
jgi:hypothetical protein